PTYTPADPAAQTGFEVWNRYDVADAETAAGVAGQCADTGWLAGRLTSVTDRASTTVTRNDARGRATCSARRLAAPEGGFAPRWATRSRSTGGAWPPSGPRGQSRSPGRFNTPT